MDDVFQNRTGKNLTMLTMFFSTAANPGLVFSCGDMSQAVFFDVCNASNVAGGQDIVLSADGMNGFTGVASAVFECVPDLDGDDDGEMGCNSDDFAWVHGEFGIDIYGDLTVGQAVTTQAITTPEPGAGLMVLFGALAFGLFAMVRRAV